MKLFNKSVAKEAKANEVFAPATKKYFFNYGRQNIHRRKKKVQELIKLIYGDKHMKMINRLFRENNEGYSPVTRKYYFEYVRQSERYKQERRKYNQQIRGPAMYMTGLFFVCRHADMSETDFFTDKQKLYHGMEIV